MIIIDIVLAKEKESSIIESLIDGEGIRVVVFTCGCPHKCKGCQNDMTWDIKNGIKYNIEEVYFYIKSILDKGNYDGITFSGGDPLYQEKSVQKLIKLLRKYNPSLNIWLYTGYVYEDIQDNEILKDINTLVDGPFIESKKGKIRFRGSSNQRLLYLKNGKIDYIK